MNFKKTTAETRIAQNTGTAAGNSFMHNLTIKRTFDLRFHDFNKAFKLQIHDVFISKNHSSVNDTSNARKGHQLLCEGNHLLLA